jgi:hypothetical protein
VHPTPAFVGPARASDAPWRPADGPGARQRARRAARCREGGCARG